MAHTDAYREVRSWLQDQPASDPLGFISRLQTAFDCLRVTYLSGALADGAFQIAELRHVPPRERPRLSRGLTEQRNLPLVATVISHLAPAGVDLSRLRAKPVNPEDLHQDDEVVLDIIYPLPNHPGRHACVILSPNLRDFTLDQWRDAHDHEIAHLAMLFHAGFVSTAKPEKPSNGTDVRLTRRERETLAWIAAGKSYWETAIIMGITERTVRYFMSNARRKLDVVNNAQAVAEAAWRDLIPRLTDPGEG